MSVSNLLSSLPKEWLNINANSLNCNSANFNNGALTQVGSINGAPIPSGGFDLNPVNVIYRPGGPQPLLSNIVNTWQQVVNKINSLNVNQILNVYIDSSIVSPALIDVSVDCGSRVEFYSSRLNAGSTSLCQINDGVVLTNPKLFSGTLQVECQSLTGPNIALSTGTIMIVEEGAQLKNTLSATTPSIQIANGNSNVISSGYGGIIATQTAGSLINVGIGSTLIFPMFINASGALYVANTISSTDGTANVVFGFDASVSASTIVNSGFTGTVTLQRIDKSSGVTYDDSVLPAYGSTNVQGALDAVKSQYLLQSSTESLSCGNVICGSLSSRNIGINTPADPQVSLQTQMVGFSPDMGRKLASFGTGINSQLVQFFDEDTIGQSGPEIMLNSNNSFPSIIATNDFNLRLVPNIQQINQGVYDFGMNFNTYTSSIMCNSLVASGSMSCGTNSMTCGSLSSSSINVNNSQAIHGVLYGGFTNSSVIPPSSSLLAQTHAISSVQSTPQAIYLTISTPNGGSTGAWENVLITHNANASSYNGGTKVYTMGYNLVNTTVASATSVGATVNYMIIY